MDGPAPPLPRHHGRPRRPGHSGSRARSGWRTACDVTYGTNTEFGFDYLRDNMARRPTRMVQREPRLRHRRRGRLDPHRRGADAAHHLGARGGLRASSTTSSPRSSGASPATRTTRSTRRSSRSRPPRSGIAKVERALGVANLYDVGGDELRPPADPGTDRQGAVPPRQGLPRRRRRGEDHRRVHGPHPGGTALERRHAPGRRGQGARQDQGREPHLGDRHPAELLPPLREARRHDRHRRDRGGGVREHLQASRSLPIPTNLPSKRLDEADLIYKTEDAKFEAVVDDIVERRERASRSSWAPPRSPSPSTSRACSTSAACPTRS